MSFGGLLETMKSDSKGQTSGKEKKNTGMCGRGYPAKTSRRGRFVTLHWTQLFRSLGDTIFVQKMKIEHYQFLVEHIFDLCVHCCNTYL